MQFNPEITNVLRDLLPWAGELFKLLTQLGSELFYVPLALVGYWAYRKRESVIVVFVLLTSIVTNYWLKVAIHSPRPPQSYWYPGASEANYGMPSGHAQNSTMLFGWLAARVKTWWAVILAVTLTLLIGVSRVYLGLHFVEDVLVGWAVGFGLLLLSIRIERPLQALLSKYDTNALYGVLFVIGLLMTVVGTYVLLPLPPDDNFGHIGGLVMGVAVAFPLERRYVNFTTEATAKWRLVLRVVLGLALVIVVMIGLSPLLPTADVWLRATRYFIVALIGGFVWPLIFSKAKL
ncbi:MAG: phosphatase PAP2 family protein [Candidatus Thorarchaeota archaeon]|nr:phosphatase PAP2 family protein [Candidatus Thorarchaeota archaeon]